ncbi:hypothetical protein G7Z17_g7892 [Cylindrodendrum hubeiense]|uniref:Uncharacterized protein n=1 Tax=Cylindrodendrum hubeiense TaxID=595255 RepID=A0A9P5LFA6_9HYPO|nr:hypothetical protein G7Z17_g7892 [Cylindrodendrum hubeiense]
MSSHAGQQTGFAPDEHFEQLPTKYVPSSELLLQVVRNLVGSDHDFRIEMRHNVYNIRSQTEINLAKIVKLCNSPPPSSSPRIEEDSMDIARHESVPKIYIHH